MKISYECSDLIEELKEDIAEVGGFETVEEAIQARKELEKKYIK